MTERCDDLDQDEVANGYTYRLIQSLLKDKKVADTIRFIEAEAILKDTKNYLQHHIDRGMLTNFSVRNDDLSVSSAQEICDDIDAFFNTEGN